MLSSVLRGFPIPLQLSRIHPVLCVVLRSPGADSKYPTRGLVACEVVERHQNEKGQELVRVSTVKPYDIESTEGISEFTVSASLVSSTPG